MLWRLIPIPRSNSSVEVPSKPPSQKTCTAPFRAISRSNSLCLGMNQATYSGSICPVHCGITATGTKNSRSLKCRCLLDETFSCISQIKNRLSIFDGVHMTFRFSSTLAGLLAILMIAQQTLPLSAQTEDSIHQEDRAARKAEFTAAELQGLVPTPKPENPGSPKSLVFALHAYFSTPH